MENNNHLTEFAKWLKIRLKNMDITPAELSRATGIKDSTISRMLAGKTRPLAETLEKISPVIGVPVSDLLILAGYPLKYGEITHDPDWENDRNIYGDEDVRLIARTYKNLSPEKKDLVKKLLLSLTDEKKQ